ncbi:hypothetical protein B0H13DRAFT_2141265, partial [Mycena leptocephala]
QKLRNLETLRTYVAKHAESWYKYIRVTRGRELENGSLYLVTAGKKPVMGHGVVSRCWRRISARVPANRHHL